MNHIWHNRMEEVQDFPGTGDWQRADHHRKNNIPSVYAVSKMTFSGVAVVAQRTAFLGVAEVQSVTRLNGYEHKWF